MSSLISVGSVWLIYSISSLIVVVRGSFDFYVFNINNKLRDLSSISSASFPMQSFIF